MKYVKEFLAWITDDKRRVESLRDRVQNDLKMLDDLNKDIAADKRRTNTMRKEIKAHSRIVQNLEQTIENLQGELEVQELVRSHRRKGCLTLDQIDEIFNMQPESVPLLQAIYSLGAIEEDLELYEASDLTRTSLKGERGEAISRRPVEPIEGYYHFGAANAIARFCQALETRHLKAIRLRMEASVKAEAQE